MLIRKIRQFTEGIFALKMYAWLIMILVVINYITLQKISSIVISQSMES